MTRTLRAASVIARRDYVATVWSRTFLLFLIGPLLPLLFGGLYGAIAASQDKPHSRTVQIVMDHADADAILDARAALASRLGDEAVPPIQRSPESDDQAVLSGSLDKPVLVAGSGEIDRLKGRLGLILDRARAVRAVGKALPPPVTIATRAHDTGPAGAAAKADDSRTDLARGGQFVLFFLTMLLAGMMISNLVEEKSSKVIETLAAAVPVDAIFLGKLVAMLGVSLTGLAVWTTTGAIGAAFLPPQLALGTPAVGWPVFVGLGILYFCALYLLIGALYLGIGAQAATVREVQTLSLPLTMGQLIVFAIGSAAVDDPNKPLALAADLFPWTTPLAMIARAAVLPDLWPHALAFVWQGIALFVMIRVGARLFRRNVLKSGTGKRTQP